MSNERKPLSDGDFLEHLWDAIYEASCENDDVLRESLIEDGIDPDKAVKRGMDLIKSLQGKQRFAQAKAKRERNLVRIKHLLESRIRQTGESAHEALICDRHDLT